MIRILLVDDHTMIRNALRLLLEKESDTQIVAEVGDGETALRLAEQLSPDVVVMDVALPGASGIETTRRLLAKYPGVKILALSSYLDRGIIQQMLDAGANGYIVKSAAGVELIQGIRSVLAGRRFLCPEVTALVVADSLRGRRSASRKGDNSNLTWRELQVTTLLAGGKSGPQIAAELHISSRTVDVHRRNIMRKLDVHNVVDLVKYAIRTGLILP
jgi:DNA-binding NarL/FixJ family response regulator